MNRYRILLIVSSCLLLIGCRESYPSIADPNANEVDEVIPSESEADLTPIMPTLNSPQFSFVTRAEGGGTGPFESWDEDREHWLNADFHVFAYQTTNAFGGQVDMRLPENKKDPIDGQNDKEGAFSTSPCLLYDRIMRVSDPMQGSVRFVEEGLDPNGYKRGTLSDASKTFYYRINDNTKKFNFFTFYADNAVQEEGGQFFKHYKDTITCRIKIDGSQDIMHSFAYHKRQDYERQVEDLTGILSKDQMNVLTAPDSYNQMLYSTVTGHRGINPIFRIRHLLSKFTINIQGRDSTETTKYSKDYLNIIISKVSFRIPSTGTFYIARDDWSRPVASGIESGEEYERQVNAGELIRWDAPGESLQATVLNNRRYIDGVEDTVYQKIFGYQTDSLFHVLTTERQSATVPILLPPVDSFYIDLSGYYLNYTYIDGKKTLHPSEPILSYPFSSKVKLYVAPYRFEPGKAYTINIYVYGPQHIGIEALFGQPWIQVDKPIEIDEDSLENSRQIKRRNFTKIQKNINNNPIINP